MRISTTSKFITAAVFGLSVISITSSMLAREALDQRLLATNALYTSITAVNMFAKADDKLTAAIRAYASTGEEHYKKEYDTELNVTQTLEHSIAILHEAGANSEEAVLIDRAKATSDALIEPEAKAFEAVAKGDLKTAAFLVYGPKYLEVKKTMAELIQAARVKVEARLTQRKLELSARAALLSDIALITLVINAIAMLTALLVFFQRKVVAPMNLLTNKTQKLIYGDNNVRFGHEDDTTELGNLARALEGYRLAGEKAEHQHKINMALTEIEQALQSASTFAEFGNTLSERLAPIMGLVYAALYLADTHKTHLSRVGGYGCDDTIHANNFAWGQSLVGQAALDQRQISLTLTADDNVDVSMGMGKLYIRNLLISPIMDRDTVLAVLELGTLQDFDSQQRQFLEALLPNLAKKIQILSGNVSTRELLEQTQQQAQALAASELQMATRRDELEASQQLAIKERQRLKNILDKSPVCISITAFDGELLFANPLAINLFGLKVGEKAQTLYVDLADRAVLLGRVKEHGLVEDFELRLYDRNHQIRTMLMTAMVTEYDGRQGLIVWQIDITERKRIEDEIKKSNMLSDSALDLTKAGYWLIDYSDPDYYTSSERAAAIFGEEPKPGWRYHLTDEWYTRIAAADPKVAEATGALYADAVAGKVPRYDATYCYKRPIDGKVAWIRAIGNIERDAEGKPLIMYGVTQDVTEMKLAEESIKHINFLNDQALGLTKAGYWHVPLDGSGWYNSSQRADDIFGNIPTEDRRYRIAEDWFVYVEAGDPEYAKATGQNFQDAIDGKVSAYDSIYAYKRPIDGRTVWIHAYGTVARDAEGKATDMYGVTQDITEYMHAQLDLAKAKEVAEDATKAKSDFLANMSHEIRTPMNAIIGMSHLALQTDLNTKQRNYIEKVDAAAKNLLGIINDILDFSKIEAGKMSMEKVDFHLEDVLEHLSDLSVIKAQDKGLELLFDVGTDVPTALVGDSLRLGQVVINLVNNAIKFTEKGEITVGIHKLADTPDGVQLRFTCKDTGIGLTEEQRKKLFSAFSQADASTTRKYGGTGLGLTISKKIVEMMQGEIGVDSVPGEGSTFHFTAIFGVQSEQRKLTVNADDVKGLRILVVDDNASAREILANILASLKFEATAVSSGAQAIGELEQGHLERHPYGLVLMDWMMPGMDGVETIRRIRADTKLAEVPAFVMVTAYSREELMQNAKDIQIDGILVKPVSPSTLLDSILNALGKEVANQTRKHEKRTNYQEAAQLVKGSHLLLVEDNEVNQELALEILQDAGLTVDVADNGKIAVEKVAMNHYDAVLMDCQMPVMDGFDATRQIRKDSRFADLPILAMTANAMAGDKEKCVDAGMNDHIAKPIDVTHLFLTLAQWIKPKGSPSHQSSPASEGTGTNHDGVPAILGLDIDGALVRMGGSVKMLRKMISRFRETQSDVMVRIKAAIENNDNNTAVREAHTVKGLSGNIGANEMTVRAGLVEGMLKRGETEGLAEALDAMEIELLKQINEISKVIGVPEGELTNINATPVEVDKVALALELKKLAALLSDMDSSAGALTERLSPQLNAVGQSVAARHLLKQVGEFEFDEALECLQEAAKTLGISLS